MPQEIYHVYVNHADWSIHAAPLDRVGIETIETVTQAIYDIEAENRDDALRLCVTQGHLDEFIQQTAELLQADRDYIGDSIADSCNGVVFNIRRDIADKEARLARFKAFKEKYAVA